MIAVDLTEHLGGPENAAAIRSAAKYLYARYRAFTTYEDVQQEIILWLLENPETVSKIRDEHSPEYAQFDVIRELRRAGDRYCRKEKAAQTGYETGDEFFYTIGQVQDLLVAYLGDSDHMTALATEDSHETRNHRPPSEGGNLTAMVADVGRAYEKLNTRDHDLLGRILTGDPAETIAKYALAHGIGHEAAKKRVRRALGRLRAELGGASPWGKGNRA